MKIKQPMSSAKPQVNKDNKMRLEVKEVTIAGNVKIKRAFAVPKN